MGLDEISKGKTEEKSKNQALRCSSGGKKSETSKRTLWGSSQWGEGKPRKYGVLGVKWKEWLKKEHNEWCQILLKGQVRWRAWTSLILLVRTILVECQGKSLNVMGSREQGKKQIGNCVYRVVFQKMGNREVITEGRSEAKRYIPLFLDGRNNSIFVCWWE